MENTTFRLTGENLVRFVDEQMVLVNQRKKSKTDMIREAGYANGDRTLYTDFYTELLRAKGITPVTDTDTADTEHDDLDTDKRDLYDVVHETVGEKWDHEQIMKFLDELNDIGIETREQFEEAYQGFYDSPEDFAEQLFDDLGEINRDSLLHRHIDWEGVWECELRHDYDAIKFNWLYYIFRSL